MRKFARSIGSEGKRKGPRGRQCPLTGGRRVVVRTGTRSLCTLLTTVCVSVKATFPRSYLVCGLPFAPGRRPRGGVQKIANSELLTAGNPTV